MKAVMLLFSKQPTRYDRPALTRGKGQDLREAVVRLYDGQVDLSPVFQNLKKDVYLLRLRPIGRDDESKTEDTLDTVIFHWDPANAKPLLLNRIKPGLHQVSVLDAYTEEPLPGEAWVLLSEPGQYEKNFSAFQQAVVLTKQWGEGTERDAVRSFLRAYLDALAEQ
ncbi:MAG TPA: hypothetical protein VGX03_13270 [Candidatus Binatia bacterium]|nr:hypothetical protein [Candidatus Binatia bacterium]